MSKTRKILTITLAMALVAAIAVSGTLAYLSNSTEDDPLTNSFVAMGGGKLLDDLELVEHKIDENDRGIYELTDTEVKNDDSTSSQEYKINPGIDLPKDPFVRVSGKTDVPSYLYVEVCTNGYNYLGTYNSSTKTASNDGKYNATITGYKDSAKTVANGSTGKISFELTSDWTALRTKNGTPVLGNNGGQMYLYTGALSNNGILDLHAADSGISVNANFTIFVLKGADATSAYVDANKDGVPDGSDMRTNPDCKNGCIRVDDVTGAAFSMPSPLNISFYTYMCQANAGEETSSASAPINAFETCFRT